MNTTTDPKQRILSDVIRLVALKGCSASWIRQLEETAEEIGARAIDKSFSVYCNGSSE